MVWQLDVVLLAFAVTCAAGAVAVRDLLASVILLGAFGLFMCLLWIEMGAVDVAFTEAAVGAGITTVFFVVTVFKTGRTGRKKLRILPLVATALTGLLLYAGSLDMPPTGDPASPPSVRVSPRYIERGYAETNVPNMVTAVLADYRSFDTLGEVTVIFTATMAVLLILRRNDDGRPT